MTSRHRQHLAGYMASHKTGSQRQGAIKCDEAKSEKKDVPVLFTSSIRSKQNVKTKRPLHIRGLPARFTGKAVINDLPDEILLEIFTYLDIGDLLSAARVCRRWEPVASDDYLWSGMFENYCRLDGRRAAANPEPGTYKVECVKDLKQRRNKLCMKFLKKINPFTGLPRDHQKAISSADISFQLWLTDRDDRDFLFQSQACSAHHMAMCLRWFDLQFPRLASIKRLRLFAISPIFFDINGKPFKNSAQQTSLLYSTNFDWSKWTKTNRPTASDDMINVYTLPEGITIATWQGDGELAFVSVGFHSNRIVQRCLYGSPDRPFDTSNHKVIPDDIDSAYGLHDYQCTVDIRNHVASIWSQQFNHLCCKKESVGNGYAKFPMIRKDHHCDHVIFQKHLQLPWKTEAFKGIVKNAVWLDITVTNERGEPFWCVSSLCKITSQKIQSDLDFDYSMEESFLLSYTDQRGKLEAQMSLNADDLYFMTRLDLKLSLDAINQWFGTNYR